MSDRDVAALGAAVLELREALGALWQRGWQPADVPRAMPPELRLGRVLADAVADELQRYAPSTVDRAWAGQLEGLEARVWWPPGSDYARARVEGGESLEDVWRQVSAAYRTVRLLPAIEQLGPRPGEARASPGEAGAPVDPRVLERVRAFLAKAESTTFPEEAETFTEAAQRLMARHRIDVALLAAADPSREPGTVGRRIGVDAPYERAKVQLLASVGQANGCRAVWSRTLRHATVVGFPADLAVVETLFTSLLVQADAAMIAAGRGAPGKRTRGFRSSFLTAYAHRIAERLGEVTEAETQDAERTAVAAGTGVRGELVHVMAERDRAVERALAELFPRVRTQRAASVSDAAGWHSGRAAADRASLAGGDALES